MTDLLALLQQFHREKLAMFLRHEDGARFVGQYDANNTYQYIINREDVQLSWLATACQPAPWRTNVSVNWKIPSVGLPSSVPFRTVRPVTIAVSPKTLMSDS